MDNTLPPYLLLTLRPPPRSTPLPYTTLFRSAPVVAPRVPPPPAPVVAAPRVEQPRPPGWNFALIASTGAFSAKFQPRSEEHTSELQSPDHIVCRPLPEKKKTIQFLTTSGHNF